MGNLAEQLEETAEVFFACLSEGACSGFGFSALSHKGPAGISAASGCWDNSSEQLFQNVHRSQFCNTLIMLGLKALQ